jgi:hypothetical protein
MMAFSLFLASLLLLLQTSHLLVASLLVFHPSHFFLFTSHAIPASTQLLFLLASVALLASHLCEYNMLLVASVLFLASTIVADVHAVLVVAGVPDVVSVPALHVTGVLPVASVSRFKPNF